MRFLVEKGICLTKSLKHGTQVNRYLHNADQTLVRMGEVRLKKKEKLTNGITQH